MNHANGTLNRFIGSRRQRVVNAIHRAIVISRDVRKVSWVFPSAVDRGLTGEKFRIDLRSGRGVAFLFWNFLPQQ